MGCLANFLSKNAPEPLPPYVQTAEKDGINYILLNGLPELLWLGNLAALEFHPSLHYVGSTLPCEWMIDLDPSREVEPRIMEAASIVGKVLRSLGLQSVPKTSGATGIQIIVPINEGITFDELRTVGHFVGMFVTEKHPELFTLERLKKNRGDKIYFDYLQHYQGKTLAAPYTPGHVQARRCQPRCTGRKWTATLPRPIFTCLTSRSGLPATAT